MKNKKLNAMAAGILATFMAPLGAHASWVATATKAMSLSDSIKPVAAAADMPLKIIVTVPIRNRSELDALVSSVNTPGSPAFGKTLTFDRFKSLYGPTADQLQAVEKYLRGYGFTNIKVLSDGMHISAEGTASKAESAFNTTMVQYSVGSKRFFVNTRDVQVPDSLGGNVVAVLGLQNAIVPHLIGAKSNPVASPTPSTGLPAQNIAACNPSGEVFFGPPFMPINCFTPQGFQTFYDAQSIGTTPASKPVNIGIFAEGDLAEVVLDLQASEMAYWPNATPRAVNVNLSSGASTSGPAYAAGPGIPKAIAAGDGIVLPEGINAGGSTSGTGEFDMDTQSSTGIAGGPQSQPGLISAVNELYIFTTASTGDFTGMFSDFVSLQDGNGKPLVKAASMSVGICDAFASLDGYIASWDPIFEAATAQGQTIFFSSGDTGASGCEVEDTNGITDSGLVPLQTSYPSSSPWIIGVGGTTAIADANNNRITETSWTAGGGGISLFEPAPAWQVPVLPAGQVNGAVGSILGLGGRGVPDVAMDADIASSATIYDWCNSDCGASATGAAGSYPGPDSGTSLASPLAVGAWARILAEQGAPNLFAGPSLYTLAATLPPSVTGFNDVIAGTNGAYTALPGYDYTTGLGTFDIANVSAALALKSSDTGTGFGFSPLSLDFGSQAAGSTTTQTVTVTNYGAAAKIAAIAITDDTGVSGIAAHPAALANYLQTNNCTGILQARSACTINVTFVPVQAGSHPALIRIYLGTSTLTPTNITLNGTGIGTP
jgi:subtilase family serine protease